MKNAVRISKVILVILSIFLIQSCKKDKPTPPVISTTAVTAISYTTATSGGEVTNEGGAAVTAKGVCWNTSLDPTVLNSKTSDGTGAGSFSSSLTGLNAGTTYYVRAWATNIAGTGYGNQVTFTTSPIALAALTTTAITSITQTTAISGGNITTDNGGSVTARGVCWGTSVNPTTALSTKTTNETGTGSFFSNLTGLQPGTIYYVRSYAINSAGTSYGNEISFTTLATLPALTTTQATSVTGTGATSGGNITSDGGATVTARGVCWSISVDPTIALSTKTTDGTGTGAFTSYITGLTPGTTYYLRAYATNSVGTTYGNPFTFVTPASLPTISTTPLSAITATSAISGGTISSDGGAAVTARGVCWGTFSNPTTNNIYTTDGSGIGSFISSITGLTANTTYYVRAYAANSVGTAYGSNVILTTPSLTVSDIDGNIYNTVTIGTQVWMKENLKTTRYNDGTAIPLVTDGATWAALSTPGYCWFNNDATTYKATYGALYNWFTVNTGKLCPTGWHVPGNTEWTALTTYLGGENVAGGKLKETGTTHWLNPNTGATNETGFKALPGGYRYTTGSFHFNGLYGYWWSSSRYDSINAWYRVIFFDTGEVHKTGTDYLYGFSVRCLKDN